MKAWLGEADEGNRKSGNAPSGKDVQYCNFCVTYLFENIMNLYTSHELGVLFGEILIQSRCPMVIKNLGLTSNLSAWEVVCGRLMHFGVEKIVRSPSTFRIHGYSFVRIINIY